MILNSWIDNNNNIVIEKKLHDGQLIELSVFATSKDVSVHQDCYIQDTSLYEIGGKIQIFALEGRGKLYVEFGKKEIGYTPSFSILLFPADYTGHIKMELDMAIDDGETSHRCIFFVWSEMGALERFGLGLKDMSNCNSVCKRISMFEHE